MGLPVMISKFLLHWFWADSRCADYCAIGMASSSKISRLQACSPTCSRT